MTGQKTENLLNLALDATQEEREKSLELEVGYHPGEREWDLILKYSGTLDGVRQIAVRVTELMNEYAIVTVAESRIEELAALEEIEYIEKPKRLFFQTEEGKRASCINEVQGARFALFGQGVLTAILDSGIDYTLPDFRNADGTTRIRSLWDQSIDWGQGRPPERYGYGREYTEEEINRALQARTPEERRAIVPSVDLSGHGTAVAGIAAGSGRREEGRGGALFARNAGVAPESGLVVVKLGSPAPDGFPRTTELMTALDYAIRKALEYRMPVAVNISFGNTYGPHDGTSLLSRFIDDISNVWKSSICIGMGNEAASAGHTSGVLTQAQEEVIELAVQDRETSLNIQIWKEYTDVIEISLISPAGLKIGPIQEVLGPQRFRTGETEILLYYGEPSPYSTNQEIYIDLLPVNNYINSGVWRIVLSPVKIVSGRYELWLPTESVLNAGTGFLYPTEGRTLTVPSTASRAVSVGAYDPRTLAYADFSGRGYVESGGGTKPDLVAPGVGITAPAPGGGQGVFSGTSFATPFVTGGAALLMEWGIVRGNDSYLYGEKVKAYLRRGARPLPGFTVYPNPQVGYGALCVRDSIPGEGQR